MSGDRIGIVVSGFHVHPAIEADGGSTSLSCSWPATPGHLSSGTYRMEGGPGDCRRSRELDQAGKG
jgi:hypothetical protein